MRARVGDLAIARFDPGEIEKSTESRWHEQICLVIETYTPKIGPREYKFLYWDNNGGKIKVHQSSLPSNRLVRVIPKHHVQFATPFNLTLNDVEPANNNTQYSPNNNHPVLGSCYRTGLAYSLGYDVHGEIELVGETFTNLDTGLDGGVIAALRNHREQFNPNRGVEQFVEQFIVALKPVKIILGKEDDEEYALENNAGCDSCGVKDRIDDINLCNDCLEDDTCDECQEQYEDCFCDDNDDEYEENWTCDDKDDEPCNCDDEFCEESSIDQFKHMNAFTRARWLKIQGK